MPGRFVRIHKSYIVALDKVSAIEGNMLKIGKTELPIGRQKRAEVMTLLLGNKD
jgi:DNA-binding LytR/AlgR family response regulator